MPTHDSPVEILAPVGDWSMLRAAIHNGADAVYLGMPNFNARGRSPTISIDELGAMIRYAHLYGVRVLVACNILIFQSELQALEDTLRAVIALSPDAIIVQDIGVARLIRAIAPDQTIHASTQMTVTNAEAIKLTEDLGFQRYVLGREVSIEEIARVRRETEKDLEVFVHGALCVSYSGQCLTSESFGGRSANRGQCAQSCRFEYDLLVDNIVQDRMGSSYLVSPQDLCGLLEISRLREIGVNSFKIEGRLKSPAYVAATARAYKYVATTTVDKATIKELETDLAKVYSRGFYPGWLHGVNHQKLVNPMINSHHGVYLGDVLSITPEGVLIQSVEPLCAGDGVVFRNQSTGEEVGAVVYAATQREEGWLISFANAFKPQTVVPIGAMVFLNSSPQLVRKLERSFKDRDSLKKVPLTIFVSGEVGQRLSVRCIDDRGNDIEVFSESLLQEASKAPLTAESLHKELGSLGGSVFKLTKLFFNVAGPSFLHHRELKSIRREFVKLLSRRRTSRPSIELVDVTLSDEHTETLLDVEEKKKGGEQAPQISLLVRSLEQLEALRGLPLHCVYLDFEFGKEYGRAQELVRDMGFMCGIATTRILKPGELGHLKVIERLRPDVVLVRNLGALQYFQDKDIPMIGDFSLNVTNSYSAQWFIEKGLQRICPSYDLSAQQLYDLLAVFAGNKFEVTVHQYMPAFHMEHCVFAAFLSTGSSYRDCGRPCEKHQVALRDPEGNIHPLKADAECRNTMFNGTSQSAVSILPSLLDRGVRNFRIEGLFETGAELAEKVAVYSQLLHGTYDIDRARMQLGGIERFGVTEGQLYAINGHRDRKKEFVSLEDIEGCIDPAFKVL